MKVNFYATFRPLVGGKTVVIEDPEGCTVAELVQAVIARFPALGPQLMDESGELLHHVHVFVNGRDVPYLPEMMQTCLEPADVVDIFPPVGGG